MVCDVVCCYFCFCCCFAVEVCILQYSNASVWHITSADVSELSVYSCAVVYVHIRAPCFDNITV